LIVQGSGSSPDRRVVLRTGNKRDNARIWA
jgi:hypothetical protein